MLLHVLEGGRFLKGVEGDMYQMGDGRSQQVSEVCIFLLEPCKAEKEDDRIL